MKVKEIKLRHCKRFGEERLISFCNESGVPHNMVLIVGDNGTGKSTVLQAIAATVGSAVRPKMKPSQINWPGFEYKALRSPGNGLPEIQTTVCLSDDEIGATQELQFLFRPGLPFKAMPQVVVSLDYPGDAVKTTPDGGASLLKGYQYALALKSEAKNYGFEGRDGKSSDLNFNDVGTILWYHEQRTAFSIQSKLSFETKKEAAFDLAALRTALVKWQNFHQRGLKLRDGQRDFYAELESRFRKLFPGKKFVGAIPRMSPEEVFAPEDFFLADGEKWYELSEMSAGERALFPILFDFANWNINNSIILIDEVELHLHPPMQQALVRMLPKLGKNNQFIMTTHSDDVAALFSKNQTIRLADEQD